MLPNVFVVGAAKSGTTALANMLACSSDIFVSEVKEPHFHIQDSYKRKIPDPCFDFDSYKKLYCGVENKYCLDASVLYLPLYEFSIDSIKSIHSDPHIIILLRDPLERAISAYKHSLRFNSEERETFSNAVRLDMRRRNGNPMLCYEWLSDYKPQVSAFKKAFSKVLLLSSEEMKRDPQKVADEVAEFLGVDTFTVETVEGNEEKFSWRSQSLGGFINKVFPGKFRYKFRRAFPGVYGLMYRLTISLLGRQERKQVDVDDDVSDLFEEKRKNLAEIMNRMRNDEAQGI